MSDEITLPPDEGRSWWLREALADPDLAGEPTPPLSVDTTADVVVLGGGYTGLWTALHLKELDPGVDVVVLEQDICGGGPSGRNGGFVNSFWGDLDFLVERFGDRQAVALCEAGEESVRAIGRFCEDNGIDAWFRADGDYAAASSDSQSGAWADQIIAAERLGLSEHFEVLSAPQMRARIDSPTFRGGVFTDLGATVQPARLARGMRRVAIERGIRIFEGCHVSRFGTGGTDGSVVAAATSSGGTVRAGQGVLALNAWAQHLPAFRRHVMVRGSYIVLTAPRPDLLAEIGWTDGAGLSNYRAALHYLRTTSDGRIACGIGGMQPNLARRIGPRFAYDERAFRIATRDLWHLFPSFREVPIDAAWGGPIDVAGLHLPTFGTMPSGNVHFALGYTGNGVGPAHLGGRVMALRSLGMYEPVLELPLVDLEPKRFPPEPVRSPGALVANEAIRWKDEAEDHDEDVNPFVDFVARLPRRLGFNLGP
jgi:glycine/D-amino acid oxidase-like deaminating enzyme